LQLKDSAIVAAEMTRIGIDMGGTKT